MKECFIITPIGGSGTETRRETDGLVKSVLSPVLAAFDLEPVPAHQISETGSITRQVIKRILESDLVIANLTELNPNVMYEVGIRHCARKPLIVVAREGTVLPFDLSDERTIFYKNDMSGTEELKARLNDVIPKAIGDAAPDNPVYRVVDVDLIKLPEGTPDVSVLANKKFSLIEEQLEDIQIAVRSLMSQRVANRISRFGIPVDVSKHHVNVLSVYIERSNDLEQLTSACSDYGIRYEVKQVYKDAEKFTAYCDSQKEVEVLQALIEKLGLKPAT